MITQIPRYPDIQIPRYSDIQNMSITDSEDKFIPKGEPIPLEELIDLTSIGEVAITRADVEKAIATSDAELLKFLQAGQKKA